MRLYRSAFASRSFVQPSLFARSRGFLIIGTPPLGCGGLLT